MFGGTQTFRELFPLGWEFRFFNRLCFTDWGPTFLNPAGVKGLQFKLTPVLGTYLTLGVPQGVNPGLCTQVPEKLWEETFVFPPGFLGTPF